MRVLASPLARRLAREHNIELAMLNGSGPRGRIVKRDIEKVLSEGVAKKPVEAKAGQAVVSSQSAASMPMPQALADREIFAMYDEGTYDIVPIDNMRKVIAERLTIAKTTIPHFYLTIDCELDQLLAARKRLNEKAPNEGPRAFKLSVNDFIIKAMALALQKVPDANTTWTGQGIMRHERSDVAVAVAVDGGLYTPVIRHADMKTLSEISNEMKDLAERARNRRLAPTDYQGGSTAISNLGMYGIKRFDAVINPPHATILAVGMGEKRPVVRGDELSVATVMSVTLSCDHRVVDGAIGAALLDAFRGFIEDPVTMLA